MQLCHERSEAAGDVFPIELLCRLCEVPRSSFYEYARQLRYERSLKAVLRKKDFLWDHRIPLMVQAYFEDMQTLLRCLLQLSERDASLWMVVSTSAYAGVEVPVDLVIAEIGSGVGWSLREVGVLRHLRSSGQHFRGLPEEGASLLRLRESVVIFDATPRKRGVQARKPTPTGLLETRLRVRHPLPPTVETVGYPSAVPTGLRAERSVQRSTFSVRRSTFGSALLFVHRSSFIVHSRFFHATPFLIASTQLILTPNRPAIRFSVTPAASSLRISRTWSGSSL